MNIMIIYVWHQVPAQQPREVYPTNVAGMPDQRRRWCPNIKLISI